MGAYFRPEESTYSDHSKFHPDEQLALLRVCRQIYNETATLTFSTNLFCFCGWEAFETVWKRLLPAQRDSVRSMAVDMPLMLYYTRPKTKLKRLWTSPCAAFPNLKTLVIETSSLDLEGKQREQFLEMVEGVRIERGLKIVTQHGICFN